MVKQTSIYPQYLHSLQKNNSVTEQILAYKCCTSMDFKPSKFSFWCCIIHTSWM